MNAAAGIDPNESNAMHSPPAILRDQADPGEPILWWGQPSARGLLRARLAPDLVATLPPSILIVFGLNFLVRTHREIIDYNPQFESNWMFVCVYVVGGFLLVLLGWFGLLAPWRIMRDARTTYYAITPRRIIFVKVRRRRIHTTSYEPRHPLTVHRVDTTSDRGDIVLPAPRLGNSRNVSQAFNGGRNLLSIPDPREVDRLIRNTFEPPAGARRFPRS